MKAKLVLLTLVSAFSLQPSALLGQGSLAPPGAPAPTMKTLSQIEPRTPISSVPFTISAPGSYYLTTNLTVSSGDAITIATNGVTLDLNGFAITSTAVSASGGAILMTSDRSDISIVNGHIRSGVTNNAGTYNGPGFLHGIYYSGTAPGNTRVAGVSVTGCLNYGIHLTTGNSTVVESCTVRTVGSYGIVASTVKGSLAVDCGMQGIFGDQVSDCRGESNGSYNGVYASAAQNCFGFSRSTINYGLQASTAQNCYGGSSGHGGLRAGIAQNCYGVSTTNQYGLYAEKTAVGCYGYSSGGIGLHAEIAQGCYGSSSSTTGIDTGIAQGCYGISEGSGTGLFAERIANNCYGSSVSGTGLYAYNASFCTATRAGGRAIQATIATGCIATAGTNLITYKYNMP